MEQVQKESTGYKGQYLEEEGRRDSWRMMFDHLSTDISLLVSREKELIKKEVSEKASDIKDASISLIVAGGFLFFGLLSLVATSIILLDKVMDLGLAAVIVTAFFLIVGAILFFSAKKKLSTDNLVPKHSIDALGQMTSTFKERINEYKSKSKSIH
jgi:uncharacterized membrane protein YqjE